VKILWLSSLDKDVMWNQNFYHERKAFGEAHAVAPYGPGFPDYNERKTAQDVWKEQGPFDLVIHQEFFLYTRRLSGLDKLPCPKVAILCDAYINGIQMHKRIWKEGGVTAVMHRYTNFFPEWHEACPDIKFFHSPWGVDPDVYKNRGSRGYDVVILGSKSSHMYPTRHKLKTALEDTSLKVLDKPHPGGIRFGMNIEQPEGSVTGDAYARDLSRARIGVATGGKPGFLVGKYFTIPGSGTALAATPSEGWSEAGFIPDVNMFLLDPNRASSQLQSIAQAEDRVQSVALAGYNLIRERHLWSHRVAAFTEWASASDH